ncbi:hypothetical protein ACFYY1_35495 [Streptomyces sp. NPDC001890]|uniref:hypothetical protein n=1 Tax=Streptomyces sp. NPDC001890 TaxID=3364620 RepID=UPI0036BEA449
MGGRTYLITEEASGAVAGEYVSGTETFAEERGEALIRWASLERPHRRHRVLLREEGFPDAELSIQFLLSDVRNGRSDGPLANEDRLNEALAGWILPHVHRNSVVSTADGVTEPKALQRAGGAWVLRTGEAVPDGVLERLRPENRPMVKHGADQMLDALGATRFGVGSGGLYGQRSSELPLHRMVLGSAATYMPEAVQPARIVLDQIIALQSEAPALPPPYAEDADLRTIAARVWFLTREHHPELAQAFHCVADPASAADRPLRTLFAALPEHLKQHPHIADEIMRAADKLNSARALHSWYGGDARDRFRDAVDTADQALYVAATAAAMEANVQVSRPDTGPHARWIAEAHGMQAEPTPVPAEGSRQAEIQQEADDLVWRVEASQLARHRQRNAQHNHTPEQTAAHQQQGSQGISRA